MDEKKFAKDPRGAIIDAIDSADSRVFEKTRKAFVKKSTAKADTFRNKIEKLVGKIDTQRQVDEAKREMGSVYREYATSSRLPSKDKKYLTKAFEASLLKKKDVESVSSTIGDFAVKLERKETMYLKDEISKEFKEISRNAHPDDLRFIAGIVKDGMDDYATDFDISKLREMKDFMEVLRKDGSSKVFRYKAMKDIEADKAIRFAKSELEEGQTYSLRKSPEEGGSVPIKEKFSIGKSWDRWVASLDMPSRVFRNSFTFKDADGNVVKSKLMDKMIRPVFDAQSKSDAEKIAFQNKVVSKIENLSEYETYLLRSYLYASQSGGFNRLM